MNSPNLNPPPSRFVKFSNTVAALAGKPLSFSVACLVVMTWAVTGPIFHYSDTWQLVINTGTTIITFLMVFLIQNSQNRDSAAIQLKLNEILRCLEGASHHIMDAEEKTLDELVEMKKSYQEVAKLAQEELEREMSESTGEPADVSDKVVKLEHARDVNAQRHIS